MGLTLKSDKLIVEMVDGLGTGDDLRAATSHSRHVRAKKRAAIDVNRILTYAELYGYVFAWSFMHQRELRRSPPSWQRAPRTLTTDAWPARALPVRWALHTNTEDSLLSQTSVTETMVPRWTVFVLLLLALVWPKPIKAANGDSAAIAPVPARDLWPRCEHCCTTGAAGSSSSC